MLSELRESFDQLVQQRDVLQCIQLKRLYLKAKDKSLPDTERIEVLIDSLLVATAYEERLVAMKIQCKSILSKVETVYAKRKNTIIGKDPDFSKRKKYDQENYLAQKLESTKIFMITVSGHKDLINDALEYVRNAQFSIKSVLSTLKEYLHGN